MVEELLVLGSNYLDIPLDLLLLLFARDCLHGLLRGCEMPLDAALDRSPDLLATNVFILGVYVAVRLDIRRPIIFAREISLLFRSLCLVGAAPHPLRPLLLRSGITLVVLKNGDVTFVAQDSLNVSRHLIHVLSLIRLRCFRTSVYSIS